MQRIGHLPVLFVACCVNSASRTSALVSYPRLSNGFETIVNVGHGCTGSTWVFHALQHYGEYIGKNVDKRYSHEFTKPKHNPFYTEGTCGEECYTNATLTDSKKIGASSIIVNHHLISPEHLTTSPAMDVFRTWDAKVFVLGRTNALNTFLCKIKDGFFPEEQGYPVYENGTKATDLGILRRRGEVNVLAYVNLTYNRDNHSFFESLRNHATWDERLHQTTIELGFKGSQVVNYERLAAFQYDTVGGGKLFQISAQEWKRLLDVIGWPATHLEAFLQRNQEIGRSRQEVLPAYVVKSLRTPQSRFPEGKIYNRKEVRWCISLVEADRNAVVGRNIRRPASGCAHTIMFLETNSGFMFTDVHRSLPVFCVEYHCRNGRVNHFQ
eukprot:m.353385 g.353385  ORF g.353385 m.353385 type:complete len:382 (+) comp20716_c0_seq47:304-1449(+)